MKIDTLFLSGCGTKGSAFIGVFKALYEKKIITKNIKRYVCVSGSSIIGVLLCCGYGLNMIYDFSKKLDYTDLLNLDDLNEIFNGNGLFTNDKIGDLIDIIIYKKFNIKNMTLKQFYDLTKIHYICKVYNLSQKCEEYFCYKTEPDMKVMTLVQMTTCIPLFFKPIKYKNNYYVDGGILCMMPYLKKYKNHLGIHIHGTQKENIDDCNLFELVTYYCDCLSKKSKKNIIGKRMIHIHTSFMPCINFDVCLDNKESIKKDGYDQTLDHLNKFEID
jgi:hypothetical protein